MWRNRITKFVRLLSSVRLQSALEITECGRVDYKVRQGLHGELVQTACPKHV